MHFKALFTFDKEKANNSQEAREFVHMFLENEGFCNSGYFSMSVADWFVIGGRWSGELQGIKIYDKVMKALGKTEKDFGISTSELADEEIKKKILKVWGDEGGVGLCPFYRDSYSEFGYEDDAVLVTKEIYDKFLKEYEGMETDNEHFWDLEYEDVSEKFIGNKWCCVVDYHN